MHFTAATLVAVLAATPAVFGQLDAKIKAKGECYMILASLPATEQILRCEGKKYFGTCSDSALLSNSQNAAIIKSDFGALTPENSASKYQATFGLALHV